MRPFILAWSALAVLPQLQDARPPRLVRPADGDPARIDPDATIGQTTVTYFDTVQRRYAAALPGMSDAQVCRSGPARIVETAARVEAKALPPVDRTQLKDGNAVVLNRMAIGTVASLDGVDAARILADEEIGPGVYHPSIAAIAYVIGRCRFF